MIPMNASFCPQRIARWMSTVAFTVGMAAFANAQTVLIDFGSDDSFRGLSVINPDSNGNYWNSLRPGVPGLNLIDIDNNATPIDLYFDTPVGTDSFNGPAGVTNEATLLSDLGATDIDATALGNLGGALEGPFDFAASPGGADNRTRFQIQQLDPAKKYTLTFFGSHKYSDDAVTVYSVYTDNTYTTLVESASLEVMTPGPPNAEHNRDKVATISNLSPQTSNIFYVEFVGATGMLGYLNDMQIEAVESPVLPGDYNADGKVDAADYVVWRKNPSAHGGDAGYSTWRTNFDRPPGAGSAHGAGTAAMIPEPASLLLAAVAMSMCSLRRRRRTRRVACSPAAADEHGASNTCLRRCAAKACHASS
jgi:hypothetical protein